MGKRLASVWLAGVRVVVVGLLGVGLLVGVVGCGEDDGGVIGSNEALRERVSQNMEVDVRELERLERGEGGDGLADEVERLKNENAVLRGELLNLKGELARLKKGGSGGDGGGAVDEGVE